MQLEGLSHVHLFSLPTRTLLSSFRLAPSLHRSDGATRGLQKEGTPATARLHVTTADHRLRFPFAIWSEFNYCFSASVLNVCNSSQSVGRGEGKLSRTILRGLGRVNRL